MIRKDNFFQCVKYCLEKKNKKLKDLIFDIDLGLDFPGQDVSEIKKMHKHQLVSSKIFSFLGACGVLPLSYHHLLNPKKNPEAHSDWAVLMLLNQRAIQLYYQSWGKYQANVGDLTHNLIQQLSFLPLVENRFERQYLRCFSSYATRSSLSVNAISKMLSQITEKNVFIEALVKEKYYLGASNRTVLSRANCLLSKNVVLGEFVSTFLKGFNIHIKALNFDEMKEFFPNGNYFLSIQNLLMTYLAGFYKINLCIQTKKMSKHQLHIGDKHYHLAWNSWLSSDRPISYQTTLRI